MLSSPHKTLIVLVSVVGGVRVPIKYYGLLTEEDTLLFLQLPLLN